MRIRLKYYLLSITFILSELTLAQIQLGAGSYNPNGQGPSETPLVTSNFSKPIIVTEWWTSILWNKFGFAPHSDNLPAHPFNLKCQSNGLGLGYPNKLNVRHDGNSGAGGINNNVYGYDYVQDIITGLDGVSFSETRVEDYSDWGVLANWTNGSNVLRARMGHGFTSTYLTKEGNSNVFVNSTGNVQVQGNVLRITIVDSPGDDGKGGNRYYAVFAPTGATWSGNGNTYTSDLAGKDYWTITALPNGDESTYLDYAEYAFSFITKTTSSYTIEDGLVTTNFEFEFDNKEGNASATMMALFRHQWKHTNDVNTSYNYVCVRGEMKVVEGNSFSITMPVIGGLPLLPHSNSYDDAKLNQLVNNIPYLSQSGNYSVGRELVYYGQCALIADQIGNYTKRDELVNAMKSMLGNQLVYSGGGDVRHLAYNDTWDITLNMTENIEHGTVQYLNDRAIQYGYWVRGAAIVEQLSPGYLYPENGEGFGPIMEMFINCVANTDRSSTMFPFLRNFDVYEGHSWTIGFGLAEGSDLESASESLNFASALLYYGQVTGKTELEEKGAWLYTNEVIGTEQYWWDVEEEVFPDNSFFEPEMLGLVRGSAGIYGLWWELRPEHVLMVNCFPWTGGALYLGRYPESCERVFGWLESKSMNFYREYWNPYIALFDPERAVNEYNSGPCQYGNAYATSCQYGQEMESEANNYYWMYTMKEKGQVYKDIYSTNINSAVVFDKNGAKNYAVYNPPGAGEKIVHFSDGNSFLCPNDTLMWFGESDAIIIEVDCNGDVNGTASIDDCDVCSGGNTGIAPNSTCLDCHGDVNGTATIDDCGVCSGGNTGVVASSPETWYSDSDNDGLGDPNENISECDQPTGYVNNGNDLCPSDPTNTCNDPVDCNGDVNGTATTDDCGVCSGGNTGVTPNSTCADCNGDPNGTASVDQCDVCSGGNTGVVVDDCLTSINQSKINQSVKIYPNPTSGDVLIVTNKEYVNWVLRDVLGRKILEGVTSNLSLANYPNGIYIIEVDNSLIKVMKE